MIILGIFKRGNINRSNSKLITLESTNAGIPFNISGAYSTSDELDLTIQNTVENSLGKNEVSGIRGASANSLGHELYTVILSSYPKVSLI